MRDFEAVIFDMDGLLLDSEKLALETFRETCVTFNLGDQSNLFVQSVGTNMELGKSILKIGLMGIAGFEQFEEFNAAWGDAYGKVTRERPVPLMSGVEELLRHIESIGVPMAVATSTITDHAQEKLGSSGILDFFDAIIGGDQVRQSKPAPGIYLKAAFELSSDPNKCLAFEDSANGVKAALAAGMTVVQIPDLVQPDEELLKMGHIVLGNLAEVLDYDFH